MPRQNDFFKKFLRFLTKTDLVYLRCGMLRMRIIQYKECWGCGMLGCGMLRIWDVQNVGCLGCESWKLSCRPLIFISYKAFLKNKKRSGTSLLATFSAWFLSKDIGQYGYCTCLLTTL